jgi:hypothetical protein
MYAQKISEAVTSALVYLEDAIDSRAELSEVEMLVWKAASDLEYGLFLFSLMDPESKHAALKLSTSKRIEVEYLLASTRRLLQEALENLETDDFKEAYKKTWLARGQLFNIHDFYEKNRRK